MIGPNGAGKSTTLKMLTGILEPGGGSALVHGLVPWRDRRVLARRIGVVFGQRSQLWSELPVRDSFALWQQLHDIDAAVFAARLGRLVERFAPGSVLQQPAGHLSLGQRMRCELVASLLHGPATLFLDEPTIGLDSMYPGSIWQGPLRLLVHTLLPAGFIVLMPARLLREPGWQDALALAGATLAYAVLAGRVFRRGLRRYRRGETPAG